MGPDKLRIQAPRFLGAPMGRYLPTVLKDCPLRSLSPKPETRLQAGGFCLEVSV